MKSLLFLILMTVVVQAEPVLTTLKWKPACDGASIEIISEGPKLLSLRAWAMHSRCIVEWSIHYIEGVPVTAEFREFDRGRIAEGEKAGDYSGINRPKRIATFKRKGSRFQISDKPLRKELEEILVKAQAHPGTPRTLSRPSSGIHSGRGNLGSCQGSNLPRLWR